MIPDAEHSNCSSVGVFVFSSNVVNANTNANTSTNTCT